MATPSFRKSPSGALCSTASLTGQTPTARAPTAPPAMHADSGTISGDQPVPDSHRAPAGRWRPGDATPGRPPRRRLAHATNPARQRPLRPLPRSAPATARVLVSGQLVAHPLRAATPPARFPRPVAPRAPSAVRRGRLSLAEHFPLGRGVPLRRHGPRGRAQSPALPPLSRRPNAGVRGFGNCGDRDRHLHRPRPPGHGYRLRRPRPGVSELARRAR